MFSELGKMQEVQVYDSLRGSIFEKLAPRRVCIDEIDATEKCKPEAFGTDLAE